MSRSHHSRKFAALALAVLALAVPGRQSAAFGQQAASLPVDFRTPAPPDTPQLNGPRIYGVRPRHPFLYRIPATGKRPITFAAQGLPATLKLDRATGIIRGAAPDKPGQFAVTLTARNAQGKDKRPFKIVVGDTIGLTPQMGWNDWYSYYDHITDADVRTAAATMISTGMADYGYQYVDIDDCWSRKPTSKDPEQQGTPRDADGNILPNAHFPGMKALTDYIHSLGLKAGIYSSPGPLTCGHFTASYQHEDQDARQIAAWGFDLLKYDWCTYGKVALGRTVDDFQKPYRLMGGLLHGLDRDVVLNMCQYGMGDVSHWGRSVGGNSWRTTGDLGVEKATNLPGFYKIGFANAADGKDAGPGGWNDPDYILIGRVGDARKMDTEGQPTTLTHEEQYSYMSMWSLMAAPLLFSGKMDKLDPFTLNVLCNREVIAVDQDSLGKQGSIVRKTDDEFVLEKPLDDGSVAVGLFNLTNEPRVMSANWQELGLSGQQAARDLWRQRGAGVFRDAYSSQVPAHGVMMVRLSSSRLLH